jgi:hypothetical protein
MEAIIFTVLLTITGIPAEYEGRYATAYIYSQDVRSTSAASGTARITNGTAALRFRTDSDCFGLLAISDTNRRPSLDSALKTVFELPLEDMDFAANGANAGAELDWTDAFKPGSLPD